MSETSKPQNRQCFWRGHLQAWSDSGLNQTDYCQANDLSPQQFSTWKRKLLSPKQEEPIRTSKKAAGFAQIYQATVGPDASGLSITLPNGSVIDGIDSTNFAVAAKLIQVL